MPLALSTAAASGVCNFAIRSIASCGSKPIASAHSISSTTSTCFTRWLSPTLRLLTGKACRDLVERRPRPVLGRTRWRADVNKAGDALVGCQTQRVERAAVVGVPFGDPVGAVTERGRGEHQAHGGGAGGQHLL